MRFGMKMFYKQAVLFIGAVVFILSVEGTVLSQDMVSEGFVGRGIAKIESGNIAGARRNALVDAQAKVVMEAVGVQVPVETMAQYFLTLKNIFFDHPEVYLQRFKVIRENTLVTTYKVTIQGFVQDQLLIKDLESMGIIGSERKKMRLLLMLAEKGIDEDEPTFWWSAEPPSFTVRNRIQMQLARNFVEKGYTVINELQPPDSVSTEYVPQTPNPDLEAACRFASQFDADIVVLGKSALLHAERRNLSSIESIQCNIEAAAIDVQHKISVVQVATYKLGMNVDETSAAMEAIGKAAKHLSDQIAEKLNASTGNMREYLLKLRFPDVVADVDVRRLIQVFNKTFPEITPGAVEGEKELWTVTVNSPLSGAHILQSILEFGIEGYTIELVSTSDNVIEFNVSSVEKKL